MTVNELIEELSKLSPEQRELPVKAGYDNYGDLMEVDGATVWPNHVILG